MNDRFLTKNHDKRLKLLLNQHFFNMCDKKVTIKTLDFHTFYYISWTLYHLTIFCMIRSKFLNVIFALLILAVLNSCGFYKRSDVKDNPVNIDERVRKNIQEGRGIRFGKGATRGGDFDFASSNPLWRASLEIFDFVPLTNASYSGGILITDWFSAENKNT